jgi:hypothetical protein
MATANLEGQLQVSFAVIKQVRQRESNRIFNVIDILPGYTVIIKATTADKQHLIQAEAGNYRHLNDQVLKDLLAKLSCIHDNMQH